MRRRLRFLTAVLLGGVLTTIAAVPAQAGPAPTPAPSSAAVADGGLTTETSLEPKASAVPAGRAQRVASRGQEAFHRVSTWRGRQPNVATCDDDDWADGPGGFVVSHYGFCHNLTGKVQQFRVVCGFSTPLGCLWSRKEEVGHVKFDVTVVGNGWDGSMVRPDDYVDPEFNQISFVTLFHNFREIRRAGATLPIKLEITCEPHGPHVCRSDPQDRAVSKPASAWMTDGGQYLRFLHEADKGTGPDVLSSYDFNYELNRDAAELNPTTAVGNTYRCDAAYYVKGGRGCMFSDVDSIYDRLSLDPTQNYFEEAVHVADALYRPEKTKPDAPAGQRKTVPGNVLAAQPQPLNRAFRGYTPEVLDANTTRAVSTCVAEWGPNYSQGNLYQCDEYPFQSTFQGAAYAEPDHNYAARVITQRANGSGGGVLSAWYDAQRILHNDPFYVWIDGTGIGGSEPPPWWDADQPPSVSAGPDIGGDEGDALLLRGSAADLEGAVDVTWTYRAGADVDAGATCTFRDPHRAATTITCTDDGTYTVTLTGSDGGNPAVTDSATVTVANVAPTLDMVGPDAWTVVRVGTPAALTATYSDPGGNDTHTCTVDWDDRRGPQAYAGNDGSCARNHTFTAAGMYSVALTVADDDGGKDSATTMIVVYDPEAGTVSGNGWLDEARRTGFDAAGSYPAATATVAQGSLTYTAQEGGLNLRAHHEIEWLVVAPDRRFAMKGTGELITGRRVGFVVYGYDDCTAPACTSTPDKLRVVIWDLANGPVPGRGAPIHDTRGDASYDLDRAQPQPVAVGGVHIAYNPHRPRPAGR
jgi:hypothetical protein